MAKKAAPELDELDAELEELTADEDTEAEVEDAAVEDTAGNAEVKSKKKKAKKAKTEDVEDADSSNGPVGTKGLAAALGTDGRNLRVMLRDKGANLKKNEETGRYEWDSVEDALTALGFKNLSEAQIALKEARDKRLNKLKEDSASKRAEGDDGKKKKKKKNKS